MANTNNSPSPLKIISRNTQGMNSPIKCRKLFQSYHSMHSDILLLQETHFPATFTPKFLHQHYPQFFLASAQNKTKGVAVCFAKHINLSQLEVLIDPLGRFLVVSGHVDGDIFTFVSYYAPNKGQKNFLSFYVKYNTSAPKGVGDYGWRLKYRL